MTDFIIAGFIFGTALFTGFFALSFAVFAVSALAAGWLKRSWRKWRSFSAGRCPRSTSGSCPAPVQA